MAAFRNTIPLFFPLSTLKTNWSGSSPWTMCSTCLNRKPPKTFRKWAVWKHSMLLTLQIGLTHMIKKRAGWLSVLFVSEMFTATAMGYFQGDIEKAAVLALFVPLILSSGGNSGSQATSLIIRAMAVRDVALRDWLKVLKREIVTVRTGHGPRADCPDVIFPWPNREKLYTKHYALVAFSVSFSVVGVVLWGSVVGAMLPILMRRLKFYPRRLFCPFRRNPRRCHRHHHLLQRRLAPAERHLALTNP